MQSAALNCHDTRKLVHAGALLDEVTCHLENTHGWGTVNIHRLRLALHTAFTDPSIDEISADDLLGEYPAVQYAPPDEGFHLDILTRLGERFDFAGLDSETVDFQGVPVVVVTARTLFDMKKDTVRAKDRGDAEALARRFKFGDP